MKKNKKDLFCFEKRESYNSKKYYMIAVLLVIMYILIFHLEKVVGDNTAKKIHKWSEECVKDCKNDECDKVNGLRGSGYYLLGDEDSPTNCLITKWEISHFIFHMFLGYYTDIYFSQTLSIAFEIYEQIFYKCGSLLDLVYNFLGFLLGHYLKTISSK